MAENRSNVFYSLSYTHHEIDELLRKIAAGNVLLAADYDKLVNIIGIDNISTFSGNYSDLKNTPNIPEYMSEIKDDIGFATTDSVNQKMDVLYDRLVSLINEYENENETIFANQDALDIQLQNLSWSLREYVEQQIDQLPLTSFATKTALTNKSDIGHGHNASDITAMRGLDDPKKINLQTALDYKSDVDHRHDNVYALKEQGHLHTDLDALNTITQKKIDYWDEHVDILSDQILIINEKLDNDLSDAQMNEKWDTLHDIAHDNLEVLNGISDAKVELWDGISYLEFKTEKAPITTQTVGGLDKGTDIDGFSIHMLLERILLPDIKPEASMTVNKNKSGVAFEKGDTVTINNITVDIVLGSNPIKTVALMVNGIQEQVKSPSETEGSIKVVFDINKDIKASMEQGAYTVKVTDTKGYNITIQSPAINFYYPSYYGVVAKDVTVNTITAAQIKAMTKKAEAKGNKTYTYNTSNQRMVFAYPASYGQLTSILDLNGFEQMKAFEKKTITISTVDGDIEYFVYMNNANTNSNFKITYKF